jgi:four helix bundle protein
MPFLVENLRVYQKALDFAEQASLVCDSFPKGTYYLSDQLNRAALSISLNIAEGNGRWHKAERKNFFYIARGSCHECVPILEICLRREFISKQQHRDLKSSLTDISKMITGLIEGIKS